MLEAALLQQGTSCWVGFASSAAEACRVVPTLLQLAGRLVKLSNFHVVHLRTKKSVVLLMIVLHLLIALRRIQVTGLCSWLLLVIWAWQQLLHSPAAACLTGQVSAFP